MADAQPAADDVYVDTRRQLHGAAESLIAGPQYRRDGTIRLIVTSSGFAGSVLPVSVVGTELVWLDGRAPLTGRIADVAEVAGLDAGPPSGVYESSQPMAAGAPFDLDSDSIARVQHALIVGNNALIAFAGQQPVLWSEHFDVAVTVDEVNYGVSPGDSYHPLPYAYVGPYTSRTGPFWNAPFGASLPLRSRDHPDRLIAFFNQGKELAR